MNITSTYETTISADQTVPMVRLEREFDAPPEKVFRAHTDPQLYARWVGPLGLHTEIDVFDCRTGGAYSYRMIRDGQEFGFSGCFHEIRPNRLMVQTFTFDGAPDDVALERIVFEDLGDGRCRLIATSLCESFEARDAFLASGMQEGVQQGYRKLDAVLAE